MTEAAKPTVYIVDDNNDVRDALSQALSLEGYATAVFGSAEDFRAALRGLKKNMILLHLLLRDHS